MVTDVTERVSLTSAGGQSNGGIDFVPSMSRSGRFVAFASSATNLVAGDTNGTADVFVRDLQLGTTVRVSVTDAEAQINGSFFLRRPDTNGIDYWIKKLESGASLASVASTFAASSEFTTKYGKLDDTEFVTLVYQNVLQRNPGQPGLSHWATKLKGGMKRGQMMTAFSESSEGIRKMAPQTDTVSLSLAMLRVVPTASQFASWRSIITNGGHLEDVVTQILATSAYASRITP